MNNARNLGFILAAYVGSVFAIEKESPPSLRKVAADAAAFLTSKPRTAATARDVATDLPYFGGEEGEKCRTAALKKFEKDQSVKVKRDTLRAIMATDLFREAADYCVAEIQLYDRASSLVCLLEEESNYNTTYSRFWGGDNSDYGYVYYDGEYDLATMMEYTQNFTILSSNVGCLADCYLGGDGCTELENWLTYSGTICKEQYCSLQWGEIDEAYHALRVCASKAIAVPKDGDKEAYVDATHSNQVTSNLCAFKMCASN
mmetsp:Transcript_1566/g.2654  ORF Transcript_1566/g.2654 Transcript_1566/m.2654 type:complete len:259 (-) Transcript_1566:239-1015(-)